MTTGNNGNWGAPINNQWVTGSELVNNGKPVPRTRSKVSIVGFAPSTMGRVRYVWDDPDMEIWAINQLYMAMPNMVNKATRWFQIHPKHEYEKGVRDHSHAAWLAQQTNYPIYMMDQEPHIPMCVRFPREQVMAYFPRNYWTNSISWEIALAIMEGFKEIHIYGVDMAQDDVLCDEYAHQRPSCEYFIGYAEGCGIKVVIPEASDLLKAMWVYPFEDAAPFFTKIQSRRQELRGRINENANAEMNMRDTRMQLIGALENMNYVERAWTSLKISLEPAQSSPPLLPAQGCGCPSPEVPLPAVPEGVAVPTPDVKAEEVVNAT
jgi:hypothetical protein